MFFFFEAIFSLNYINGDLTPLTSVLSLEESE